MLSLCLLLSLVKVLISSLSFPLIKIHVDVGSQQVVYFIALMNTEFCYFEI